MGAGEMRAEQGGDEKPGRKRRAGRHERHRQDRVRNIRRHRTKTLIIGVLITIGITVLIVGNSLMDTASRDIQKTYWKSTPGTSSSPAGTTAVFR